MADIMTIQKLTGLVEELRAARDSAKNEYEQACEASDHAEQRKNFTRHRFNATEQALQCVLVMLDSVMHPVNYTGECYDRRNPCKLLPTQV